MTSWSESANELDGDWVSASATVVLFRTAPNPIHCDLQGRIPTCCVTNTVRHDRARAQSNIIIQPPRRLSHASPFPFPAILTGFLPPCHGVGLTASCVSTIALFGSA